jgi:hypothetical protein
LLKLGFEVAQSSVAKYMLRRCGPPSQGWCTFLRNHAPDIAAMDLFVVPTIGFDLLYVLVIVRLARRDLVWINVTTNPTAEWIARQITEAFPWNEAPRYLIRDRDCVYGAAVTRRLRAMGIRDKPIASGSPWQNGFAERLIGSIRRECVDHVIVLGEAHLRRILAKYAAYYNELRTHRSLGKDAPIHRAIQHVAASHRGRSWADFIIIIAESDFRYRQADWSVYDANDIHLEAVSVSPNDEKASVFCSVTISAKGITERIVYVVSGTEGSWHVRFGGQSRSEMGGHALFPDGPITAEPTKRND